ncbi:MAG: N-acetyl-gamma-glutamyl-phosphate reductase [Clostridia bacterium]|nr:N-acetyl-gamma-glutamyl-phosphate reductase [Clostridia bacterium]
MKTVFIDGKEGTTGLRIFERLENYKDIKVVSLPEETRKDPAARKEMLNSCDIAFLCLPDAAAKESVSLVENENVVVIDTSTAHRCNDNFAYGFPELSESHLEKIRNSNRIAVPGCHASGFISLVAPLVACGVLDKDVLLTCHSLTGYSGGGKKMIADYEDPQREVKYNAPRQYGLTQEHKHIPEMVKISGITNAPVFCPIVADYYSGMLVTVPLFASQLKCGIEEIKNIYRETYKIGLVKFTEEMANGAFLDSNTFSGNDTMEVSVYGNEERIILAARYDNLGKGASGAAVECLNIKLNNEWDYHLNV